MAVVVATARALGGLLHDLTDEELLALTTSDNRTALKKFLAMRIAQMLHKVSYDQSVGLESLIERAVGQGNPGNINRDITQERFPLKGTGVRQVLCRAEACLDGEMSEQAAKRLADAGRILASTGDLAGFLHDHPEEVAKWQGWVLAISEDSWWTAPSGRVCVPCACVRGAHRYFYLFDVRNQLDSKHSILVLGE